MATRSRDGWTVGIPTFNRYHLLKQALASAEGQTQKPAELIVSDNCSTDQTATTSISDTSIRFRYFRHSEPVPPIENFRNALAMCETEYFSWLQDDDYYFPLFGQSLLDALDAHPDAAAAVCYAFLAKDIDRIRNRETLIWGPPPFCMDFDHKTVFPVSVHALIPWLTHFWPGFSPVAIYRTEALTAAMSELPALEGCSSFLIEQYLFSVLNKNGTIVYVPAVLGVLREHAIRVTNQYGFSPDQWKDSMLELYSYMYACLPADTSSAEAFFAENIKVFDAEEIGKFYATLRLYEHPLADLVLLWLSRHSPFPESPPSVVSPSSSGATSGLKHFSGRVARNLLPPILLKMMRYLARGIG